MEGTSRSRLGPDSLLLEGFLLINHHVASVALLDLSTSNRMLNGTIDIVERCFTSWQVGSVSEGRVCAKSLPLGAGVPPALLPVFFRPYTKMAYFHFRGGGVKCWTGSCDFAHALFRHGLDLVEIWSPQFLDEGSNPLGQLPKASSRREETICSLFWWSGLGHLRGQNQERSPRPPITIPLPLLTSLHLLSTWPRL